MSLQNETGNTKWIQKRWIYVCKIAQGHWIKTYTSQVCTNCVNWKYILRLWLKCLWSYNSPEAILQSTASTQKMFILKLFWHILHFRTTIFDCAIFFLLPFKSLPTKSRWKRLVRWLFDILNRFLSNSAEIPQLCIKISHVRLTMINCWKWPIANKAIVFFSVHRKHINFSLYCFASPSYNLFQRSYTRTEILKRERAL